MKQSIKELKAENERLKKIMEKHASKFSVLTRERDRFRDMASEAARIGGSVLKCKDRDCYECRKIFARLAEIRRDTKT